jgi:translocator protein
LESTSKLSSAWKFFLAILLCEGVGITSGLLASASNNMWFESLVKPSWNPPAYLFGPVWTTLYLLMGISLGLIWTNKSPEKSKRKAYFLFAVQLFLNFWWSILFFLFHSTELALVDIVLMVVLITLTIFSFSSFSRTASWLLVPYLAWVCFASYLNCTIWILNR